METTIVWLLLALGPPLTIMQITPDSAACTHALWAAQNKDQTRPVICMQATVLQKRNPKRKFTQSSLGNSAGTSPTH